MPPPGTAHLPTVVIHDDEIARSLKKSGTELTPLQRAAKQAQIAKLALRGWNYREIAPEVDLHPTTVGYFMKQIEADWREDAARSIDELKSKELARLDHLEAVSWDAWERSKAQRKSEQIEADISVEAAGTTTRRPRRTKLRQEERVAMRSTSISP